MKNPQTHWNICTECQGRGRRSNRLTKKTRLKHQKEIDEFTKNKTAVKAPAKPKNSVYPCLSCEGSGLVKALNVTKVDRERFPHISIIGGGIGGVALAIACLHRGIPFSLYERDSNFADRAQGYGLTLQQASKAIQGFGIFSLEEGIVSTRHVVHTTDGSVIGEWGMRKWKNFKSDNHRKRTNIHISRQALRKSLFNQLGNHEEIKWGHKLTGIQENEDKSLNLTFEVDGKLVETKTDLIVGADGIRSTVRKSLFNEKNNTLRYLNCIVILGICSMDKLSNIESELLDSETVFQTANGTERIYMMPYSKDAIMWQLSFPMPENDAKDLSSNGAKALKDEACKRLQWHSPIPEIINATPEDLISGYPVYDREIHDTCSFNTNKNITLIGDAAHPMSPFKGQGANQALLDSLALARNIVKECRPKSGWEEKGIRESVLVDFEKEMFERAVSKVRDSAKAAELLHSEEVLKVGNGPRGKIRPKEA